MRDRQVFGRLLQMARPLQTGGMIHRERQVFLVRVTDGKHVGWGEAAPLERWGSESVERCALELARWELDGTMPTTPSAQFAVDMALLDVSARQRDEGIWQYLGGERRQISLQAAIGSMGIEETLKEVTAVVTRGFRAVKLKVGSLDVEVDIRRVFAVSEEFPELMLRVDANGAWGRDSALRFIRAVSGLNVDLVEQPLPPEDVEGLSLLRGLGVRIAADEAANDARVRKRLLKFRGCDVVVLKPSVLGTVEAIREIVESFRGVGIDVMFSSAIESAVGRMAVAHLVSALSTLEPSGLNTADWLKTDVALWPLVNDSIELPVMGLGLSLETAELKLNLGQRVHIS